MDQEEISIQSQDYWVKIVEMLQQNWALIEETEDDKVVVYFISRTSTVFDELFILQVSFGGNSQNLMPIFYHS